MAIADGLAHVAPAFVRSGWAHDPVRRRAASYAVVAAGMIVGFALLRGNVWRGDAALHTVMEAMATFLALLVGVLALVRFYSKQDNAILFVGVAFLGTAFLDGYHGAVTSAAFNDLFPSTLSSLSPWSWFASRLFLAILMWLSYLAQSHHSALGSAGRITEIGVFALAGVLTTISFLFFALVPLPRAYFPELLFPRPEEFAPAAFFLLALVGYLRRGRWRDDIFEHWVVVSLIVGFSSQAMFMSLSGQLFDGMFDVAHTLKNVSYICVLAGLLVGIYHMFRNEAASAAALRASEAKARAIFTTAADAIITIDKRGAVESFNPAAELMFGCPAAEVMGRNVSVLMTASYRDAHDGYLARYMRTGETKLIGTTREVTGRRKDGSSFPMELSVSEVPHEDRRIFAGIIRDISERHEAREALHASQASLLNQSIELSRSNKELDDFAYIASHDLKEPLRGIHNYATFLLEDYRDRLDGTGKDRLETLTRLTARMEALINDLLHFSRVGRVELATVESDLNCVVSDVLDTLHISLEEHGVEVRIPRPLPTVICDETRVGELFRNLITNAAKYNDKPVRWIEIGVQERADQDDGSGEKGIVFYVRDNGIGIREKHFETIFRIFKRLHGRDKFGGGTGAGMSIVNKIVEGHNGRVWLESEEGEGTTFYFTLHGPPGGDRSGSS